MSADKRTDGRAETAPAEERRAGSADPRAQAEAVLADSDRRQEERERTGGTVEHRSSQAAGETLDR
jgi:hypothetical protein